ncbi:unnamed protein product [Pleuronectes platessa]|uniref:Uncharacterized protein n=1 Tax=Pleuronectes platessa TaxID=8262 RepID=A0A9N7TNY0_PLEPL|nr:unnamed protein product [Pleuronectes platessa]
METDRETDRETERERERKEQALTAAQNRATFSGYLSSRSTSATRQIRLQPRYQTASAISSCHKQTLLQPGPRGTSQTSTLTPTGRLGRRGVWDVKWNPGSPRHALPHQQPNKDTEASQSGGFALICLMCCLGRR